MFRSKISIMIDRKEDLERYSVYIGSVCLLLLDLPRTMTICYRVDDFVRCEKRSFSFDFELTE